MPYYATTGAPFQYQKANGGLASNYYLKYYAAGTSTAILAAPNETATDELGQALLLDKIRLSTQGYPVAPSGGVIIPHLDQAYKIVLYKNSSDADADNTASADWVVDDLSPGLIGFVQSTGANASTSISYIADVTGTTRTISNKLQEFVSVKDFGAVGDGVTDDSTAISTALLAAKNIVFPEGTYLTGGVIVQRTEQSLHFQGNVNLRANANGVVLFKQVARSSKHTGSFFASSNSKSSVYGMQVGPSDLNDTSTINVVTDCTLPGIVADSGIEECVIIQCGPAVGASVSFNQGNLYGIINGQSANRTLWLKSAANAGAIVPKNNVFDIVLASAGNTGIEISAGSHNIFNNVLISASSGGSPNATPTGIVIDNLCSTTSTPNDYNTFLAGRIQNSSRDINNVNGKTQLGGLEFSISNSLLTRRPMYFNAVREANQIYSGIVSSTGSSVKLPEGWGCFRNSTGRYTINHNLGSANYGIVVSGQATDVNAAYDVPGSNSVEVWIRLHSFTTFKDARFSFIIFKY